MIVDVGDPQQERRVRVILSTEPASGLEHETLLSAGVAIGLDVTAPTSWRWVEAPVAWPADAEPLLAALLGTAATEQLGSALNRPDGGPDVTGLPEDLPLHGPIDLPVDLSVDLSDAQPWLRVAAAEALDRWLYLPLNQDLVDAERAAALGQAALTLAEGSSVRSDLLSQALNLARGAASGLTQYLGSLSSSRQALPSGLKRALEQVMDGYGWLREQVHGPDRELQAALDGWTRLSSSVISRKLPAPTPEAPDGLESPDDGPDSDGPDSSDATGSSANLIDPRQVPARRIRLAGDPRRPEISLADASVSGLAAVLVQVPAYRDDPAPAPGHLLVRLVERRSGQQRSHAMLTLHRRPAENRSGTGSVFQGTLPLRGARISDVRADIYEAASTLPPAVGDDDRDLQQARRATLFLREWRRLVAAARLPAEAIRPAVRLRSIGRLLQPVNGEPHADAPFFAGGPSAIDLDHWSDLGDDYLLAGMRQDATDDPAGSTDSMTRPDTDREPVGGFTLTRGSARLLLAELAAAFSTS